MGNETSKKMLLIDDDDVPKKKRFSLTRSSHENQGKDKNFDISEKELRELQAAYNQNNPVKYYPEAYNLGAITPFYPPLCLAR